MSSSPVIGRITTSAPPPSPGELAPAPPPARVTQCADRRSPPPRRPEYPVHPDRVRDTTGPGPPLRDPRFYGSAGPDGVSQRAFGPPAPPFFWGGGDRARAVP